MKWYAVHTQARQEGSVAAKLWQFYPVFLPRRWVSISHARSSSRQLRPIMPRYLMVKARPEGFRMINDTDGVSTLINVGGEPRPVPDRIMDAFRAMFDEDGVFPEDPQTHFTHTFKPGDSVQFKQGPLEGVIAEITALDKTDQIRVATELFGRIVSTSAPAEWAELVA